LEFRRVLFRSRCRALCLSSARPPAWRPEAAARARPLSSIAKDTDMAGNLPKLPAWHAGEIYLQERIGVAERMRAVGQRVVRDYMPDQHREFYAQLPVIVLGRVDGA